MKATQFELTQDELATLKLAEKNIAGKHVLAAVRDLFALGIFLRRTGHRDEGYKACSTALRALALNERLSKRILANLDEAGDALAVQFWAHVEFTSLLENTLAAPVG
ncbi:MAG: hypothetical protein ACAI37_01755 [Chthoniobacter sp.]